MIPVEDRVEGRNQIKYKGNKTARDNTNTGPSD